MGRASFSVPPKNIYMQLAQLYCIFMRIAGAALAVVKCLSVLGAERLDRRDLPVAVFAPSKQPRDDLKGGKQNEAQKRGL